MSEAAAIVSDKQLGDVLLLQPSAHHLAQVAGNSTALFVRDAFRPLVELMPGCVWGPENRQRFSEVWTTSWSSRAVWQAFRLRTRKRRLIVNKPRHIRWWYRFVFHDIRLEPPSAEYWARYFWRVVSGKEETEFIAPQLKQPPADWKHPALPVGPFILINPTAAWKRKFWGEDQWAEIIQRLVKQHPSMPVVIAGGGSEREVAHCQSIADLCSLPVLNLAGKTSLKEYLHLVSAAQSVLCIDGAASHLAQAFGIPTVTVFGPTHEGKWHWPTPHNVALAARQFNEAGAYGSASAVPVEAMWAAVCSLKMA
ncbi:hypothetical protein GCM10023213_29980 [Prosthecobacter algae]|uniref:ADP-heptose:LPS heptosyltransferase n=1 Tax=Prosthecobacter algae TaxID=1144682 RepID=A0ABP9PG34_9BACT